MGLFTQSTYIYLFTGHLLGTSLIPGTGVAVVKLKDNPCPLGLSSLVDGPKR